MLNTANANEAMFKSSFNFIYFSMIKEMSDGDESETDKSFRNSTTKIRARP